MKIQLASYLHLEFLQRAFPGERLIAPAYGRVHKLKGQPGGGGNSDAEYVWNLWRGNNCVETFVDVNSAVWAEQNNALALSCCRCLTP